MASVCIDRIMQMSSITRPVCGSSSLSHVPASPHRRKPNFGAMTGKLF